MLKEKFFAFLSKIPRMTKFFQLKWLKRLLAFSLILLMVLWGGAFSVFHFYLKPNTQTYKQQAEHWFGREMDGRLTIGRIDSQWVGLGPEFTAYDIKIQNHLANTQPLELKSVILKPSWWSLFSLSPRFSYIGIDAPELAIVRNKQNQWSINGVLLNLTQTETQEQTDKKPNFKLVNILLQQQEIAIDQANISFEDQFLAWPKLALNQGGLRYQQTTFARELTLDGMLDNMGKRFDLTINWQGSDANNWQKWSGRAKLDVISHDKSNFSQYLGDFFKSANIEGRAKGMLEFSNARLDDLKLSFDFTNAQITDQRNNQLLLPKLRGDLHIRQQGAQHYFFNLRDVDLVTGVGSSLSRGLLKGNIQLGKEGSGKIEMNRMNLAALDPILNLIGAHQNPIFQLFDLKGSVENLSASWSGEVGNPQNIKLQSGFTDLSWAAVDNIPSLNKLSGQVNFADKSGTLVINGRNVELDLARLYDKPIAMDSIDGQLKLTLLEHGLTLGIDKLTAQNKDLRQVSAEGTFTHYFDTQAQKLTDSIDLKVNVAQANATVIKEFLPKIMKPKSKEWLLSAFLSGSLTNISAQVKGDPKAFPFAKGVGGQFSAQGKVEQLELHFAPDWPTLKNVNGQVRFANEDVIIEGNSASSHDLKLKNTQVVIHDLTDKDNMWMDVNGSIAGSLPQFLDFSRKTPIVKWTKGFIEEIQGSGPASMDLKIRMPLHHVRDAQVWAGLRLNNNTVEFTKTQSIPKLNNVSGVLTFTEEGVNATGVKARAYGGWVYMNAKVDAKRTTQINLSGRLDTQTLLSFYWPEAPLLAQGMSDYQAQFGIGKGLQGLSLKSTLTGTKWLLPLTSVQSGSLDLQLKPLSSSDWQINAQLGQKNKGKLNIHNGLLSSAAFVFGGEQLPPSQQGIRLMVYEKQLNLNDLLVASDSKAVNSASVQKTSVGSSLPIYFTVVSEQLKFADTDYGQVTFNGALAQGRLLTVDVRSAMATGQIKYDLSMQNKLTVRLSALYLSNKKTATPVLPDKGSISPQTCSWVKQLPQLNVLVDHLYLGKQDYGVLSFNGQPYSDRYQVNNVSLVHPDANIVGEMAFVAQAQSCPRLDAYFVLDSRNFGSWLTRTDLSKQVDGGTAQIKANLTFPSVDTLALKNLQGDIDVRLKEGRFVNVQPGFGRILGIFDVGMLGKRISLNFKDVFLPGLTFETISATGKIRSGVLSTNHLNIDAAGIAGQMNGSVDLSEKKLNMKLRVSSNLTHGVVDAIVDNLPVATASAQENVEASEEASPIKAPRPSGLLTKNFQITGDWQDPKVKRN